MKNNKEILDRLSYDVESGGLDISTAIEQLFADVDESTRDFPAEFVDCSGNPYDVRPATDKILDMAAKLTREKQDGKPVVILMGENHDTSAHMVLQHDLVSRLSQIKAKASLCFEYSNNIAFELAPSILKDVAKQVGLSGDDMAALDLPEDIRYQFHIYDKNGLMGIAIHSFNGSRLDRSNVAKQNLKRFCYNHRFPCAFTDVAKKYSDSDDYGTLDNGDPDVGYYARELGFSEEEYSTICPEGMAIRNAVIAERIMECADHNNSDVVVQITGMAHVFGEMSQGFAYEHSLHAALEKHGAHILPVIIDKWKFSHKIPEGAEKAFAQSVFIKGLPESSFEPDEADKETALISRMHKESGGELKIEVDHDSESLIEIFENMINQLFDIRRSHEKFKFFQQREKEDPGYMNAMFAPLKAEKTAPNVG